MSKDNFRKKIEFSTKNWNLKVVRMESVGIKNTTLFQCAVSARCFIKMTTFGEKEKKKKKKEKLFCMLQFMQKSLKLC